MSSADVTACSMPPREAPDEAVLDVAGNLSPGWASVATIAITCVSRPPAWPAAWQLDCTLVQHTEARFVVQSACYQCAGLPSDWSNSSPQ